MFQELTQFKNEKNSQLERVRERLITQEKLVDSSELQSILEYIAALFDEGQYRQAAMLWAKADFEGEESMPTKYYRILALVHQDTIEDLSQRMHGRNHNVRKSSGDKLQLNTARIGEAIERLAWERKGQIEGVI